MSGTNPTPKVSFEQEGAASTPSHITELNRNDVLMGRGATIDRFVGNVRFRELIKARKVEYSSTGLAEEKNRIAREIVATVLQSNGRFLCRVRLEDNTSSCPATTSLTSKIDGGSIDIPLSSSSSSSSSSNAAPVWTLVSHKAAIDKVKQALRDCTTTSIADTTTATTFISPPNVSPHEGPTTTTVNMVNNSNVATDIEAQSMPVTPTAQMIQPQVYRGQHLTAGCTVDPIIASLLLHPADHTPSDSYPSALNPSVLSIALNSSVLPIPNDIMQRPPQQQEQQSSVPYLPQYSIPHISPDQSIGLATTLLLNRGDTEQRATLEGQALRQDVAFVTPISDKNQFSFPPRTTVSESLLHVLQLRRRTDDNLMSSGYISQPHSSIALFPVSEFLGAVPALRWNEIPDVYLRLLVAPQMQGPSSSTTFTGDDLQILLRTKTTAEIAGDYHCWGQIRLIFESVVELPTVRHELCPADVHTLITVLHGMKIQSNGGCRVGDLGFLSDRTITW